MVSGFQIASLADTSHGAQQVAGDELPRRSVRRIFCQMGVFFDLLEPRLRLGPVPRLLASRRGHKPLHLRTSEVN